MELYVFQYNGYPRRYSNVGTVFRGRQVRPRLNPRLLFGVLLIIQLAANSDFLPPGIRSDIFSLEH